MRRPGEGTRPGARVLLERGWGRRTVAWLSAALSCLRAARSAPGGGRLAGPRAMARGCARPSQGGSRLVRVCWIASIPFAGRSAFRLGRPAGAGQPVAGFSWPILEAEGGRLTVAGCEDVGLLDLARSCCCHRSPAILPRSPGAWWPHGELCPALLPTRGMRGRTGRGCRRAHRGWSSPGQERAWPLALKR